jgi:hypothetical protein
VVVHSGRVAVDSTEVRPRCVECGLPEGRRGHRCLAHPRPPALLGAAAVTILAPLPLYFVLGPIAFAAFVPCLLFAWWVKTR